MSDPNDKMLDDYLRRDSIVSERYRELDSDDVPASVDDAVLAQARIAVAPRKPQRPNWLKWGGPIALAASAVMAVAIVLEVGVDEEVRLPAPQAELATASQPTMEERVVEDLIQEAPMSPAAPAPPRMDNAQPPAEQRAQLSRKDSGVRGDRQSTERAAIESVTVQSERAPVTMTDTPIAADSAAAVGEERSPGERDEEANAPAEPFANSQGQTRDVDESESVVTTGSRADASQARSTSTATPSVNRQTDAVQATTPRPVAAQQAPRLAPEVWLEQIRSLRREGKLLEADEQWKQFSTAYPQYEVAQTDSARPNR